MRTVGGVLLGILLFFPGILLLQWLSVDVLGIYGAVTLTDGCLVMIIILLSINLVHGRRTARPASRATRRNTEFEEPTVAPRLRYLPGDKPAARRGRGSRSSRR